MQTWLVHADFIGSFAAYFSGCEKIIWNIRYSKIEIKKSKFSTVLIIKLLSILSFYLPKLIVVVSKELKKFINLLDMIKIN